MGKEGDYLTDIYIYIERERERERDLSLNTVTTRTTPALRCRAAIKSHFNVSLIVRDKTVSTNHNIFEEKGEPKRNRAEALLLISLTIRPHRFT